MFHNDKRPTEIIAIGWNCTVQSCSLKEKKGNLVQYSDEQYALEHDTHTQQQQQHNNNNKGRPSVTARRKKRNTKYKFTEMQQVFKTQCLE